MLFSALFVGQLNDASPLTEALTEQLLERSSYLLLLWLLDISDDTSDEGDGESVDITISSKIIYGILIIFG